MPRKTFVLFLIVCGTLHCQLRPNWSAGRINRKWWFRYRKLSGLSDISFVVTQAAFKVASHQSEPLQASCLFYFINLLWTRNICHHKWHFHIWPARKIGTREKLNRYVAGVHKFSFHVFFGWKLTTFQDQWHWQTNCHCHWMPLTIISFAAVLCLCLLCFALFLQIVTKCSKQFSKIEML